MNPPPADPGQFERMLELLGPMLTADSLEEAAAHATRLFSALSEAEAVALFLVSGKDTGAEFWVSADETMRLRLRPHLRGLALEFLAQGVPVATPFPPEVAGGDLQPTVLPLLDRGHTLGVVCLAGSADAAARCSGAAVVVAREMAQHQESAQSQASRARYERWFRQFDTQMRLLERERQKFAAFVNQSDTFVFTADAARTVRWANRALTSHFGGDRSAPLVGRGCDEVWARLGEPGGASDEPGCPVARAFASGRPAHQEFRPDPIHPTHAYYATALPIRDPDGRPREVLVVAQDLGRLEILRRTELGLQAVVARAPVVLFSLDRDGIFRLSEGRGLDALGLRPGEVVGRSVDDVYRDHPEIVERVRGALRGEEHLYEARVGEASFETRLLPQRNEMGDVVGVVGVAVEVNGQAPARRPREADESGREAA